VDGGFTLPVFKAGSDTADVAAALFDLATHFQLSDDMVEALSDATDRLADASGLAESCDANAAALLKKVRSDYAQLRAWAAKPSR
jgi:hypothetical protein